MNHLMSAKQVLPEAQILLACANPWVLGAESPLSHALAQESVNWDLLLRAAELHKLKWLLYWKISGNKADKDKVPKELLMGLRSEYAQAAHRMEQLQKALSEVMEAFVAHDIPVLPWKGPSLAQIYPEPALRPCYDLDLIVPKEAWCKAQRILKELNYSPGQPEGYPPITDKFLQSPQFLKLCIEHYFVHEKTEFVVDLHWAPFDPSFVQIPWKMLEEHSRNDRTTVSIAPELMISILAAHACKHCWSKFIWVADIAGLIMQGGLDWEKTLHIAHKLGSENMLLLGIALATNIPGVVVPSVVAKQLSCNVKVKAYTDELMSRFFTNPAARSYRSLKTWLFHANLKRTRLHTLGYAVSLVMTPALSDWASAPGLVDCYPAFYLIRPAILIKCLPAVVWRFISGGYNRDLTHKSDDPSESQNAGCP